MKLVLDMNLSPLWCGVLEARGHTCCHWSAVGRPTATDAQIMTWAADNGYVVLTHDLDFEPDSRGWSRRWTPTITDERLEFLDVQGVMNSDVYCSAVERV